MTTTGDLVEDVTGRDSFGHLVECKAQFSLGYIERPLGARRRFGERSRVLALYSHRE
jgi:hypothetical protein